MAKVSVEFEREHGTGLEASSVYVNGEHLPFVNHKARKSLDAGKEFELYWRIAGSPGATFTVKYTAGGITKTIVDKDKIPSGNTTWSDFTFVML